MEKSGKITKSEFKNEWAGPNGPVFYHNLEFDNGDKGSIGAKDKNPAKLNVGESLTYTLTDGKIKAVQSQNGFSGGGAKSKPSIDPRVQFISFSMSYAKDLCVAGKISEDKLIKTYDLIYSKMEEKYNQLMAAK